jgi:hypothetical protein
MSDDAPVDRFTLTMKLDASLSISSGGQLQNWIKPGVEASVSWQGIPTEEQVAGATEFLNREIVEPIVAHVIKESQDRLQQINA